MTAGTADKPRRLENTVRWIPVTEDLPKRYQSVIIFVTNGVLSDWGEGFLSGDDKWIFARTDWKEVRGVTHWQPMPEPPNA